MQNQTGCPTLFPFPKISCFSFFRSRSSFASFSFLSFSSRLFLWASVSFLGDSLSFVDFFFLLFLLLRPFFLSFFFLPCHRYHEITIFLTELMHGILQRNPVMLEYEGKLYIYTPLHPCLRAAATFTFTATARIRIRSSRWWRWWRSSSFARLSPFFACFFLFAFLFLSLLSLLPVNSTKQARNHWILFFAARLWIPAKKQGQSLAVQEI